jgi:hypothetical protein
VRVLRIVFAILAGLVLLVTVLGRSMVEAWPFELFSNFPMQFGAVAFVLLVATAITRARIAIALTIAALVANGIVVGQTLMTDRRPAAQGAQRLTFAHINAQSAPIDVGALRREVFELRPAVFIVLDPAPAELTKLVSPPSGYRTYRTRPRYITKSRGTRAVIWTRVNLFNVRHPVDNAFGPSALEFSVRVNGRLTSFLDFGSVSPMTPGRADKRNRTLEAAARWSNQQRRDGREQRIVMGDLNATPWSPVFRQLLDDGRLHSSLNGFGIQPTWPMFDTFLRIPIDHMLLSARLTATDRRAGPSFGSEHRSLWVTVSIAE